MSVWLHTSRLHASTSSAEPPPAAATLAREPLKHSTHPCCVALAARALAGGTAGGAPCAARALFAAGGAFVEGRQLAGLEQVLGVQLLQLQLLGGLQGAWNEHQGKGYWAWGLLSQREGLER